MNILPQSDRAAILWCAIVSACACALLLLRLPLVLPLFDATTRHEAIDAMQELRRQGKWALLAEPLAIERTGDRTCITWEYRYRGREGAREPTTLFTCNVP